MERILRAIENNPEALFFKIVDAKGVRKANGQADDSEDLIEALTSQLDYLPAGNYTIFLGKGNNLSHQRATVTLDYKIGNAPITATRNMSNQIGFISIEEAEKREQKAFEDGKREAILLDHEKRLARAENDIKNIITKVNEVIKVVDGMDGEEDGNIGDKAVQTLQQFSAAKEALAGFKL